LNASFSELSSISIENIESNSLLPENIIQYFSIKENSSSSEVNNNNKSFENNIFIDNPDKEKSDYYDNFYDV